MSLKMTNNEVGGVSVVELDGRIDSTNVASAAGAALSVPLGPGVHDVQLRVSMTGQQWTFIPRWDGHSAFQTATPSGTS